MKADTRAVILVGHGGVPSDCPPAKIGELKKTRLWSRTAENDPYQAGLRGIQKALQAALPDHVVYEAYNEFCPPTLEEALEAAVKDGAKAITVISTMFTRGGLHSELEIPEILAAERGKHPGVDIRYVWPFDMAAVSGLLAAEVRRTEA